MGRRYYRSGQFARKASVSVRTLRFYDQVGLLSPSRYSEAGYRLYSDDDLIRLQQILALKFLGFSLDEVKACLRTGPHSLAQTLVTQKAMLREKRAQIDTVIRAIEQTEKTLGTGEATWEMIVKVLEALQMQQTDEWQNRYFTPEQREAMERLSKASYSDEARANLAARRPWTEEDQKRVDAQYAWIGSELKRLVAEGAEPASEAVLAVARVQRSLLAEFTGGDPEVASGLNTWWQGFNQLPAEERPFTPPYSGAEAELLWKAIAILDQDR